MAACASQAVGRAGPMSAAVPARETLLAWLHLASVPGLPAAACEALLRAFDSIEALFGADHARLAALAGPAVAHIVLGPRGAGCEAAADAVLDWLATPHARLLTRHDPAYPPRIAMLYDPPPLLYVRGDPAWLQARAVAMVGSRLATPQGRADAAYFARRFADAGLVVVSGLARGIDAAAHRGALEGAAGTVAVVGTGLDRVYPAAHRQLARQIAEHGALLSEWPLGTPARAANFPQRNRLIAALCEGVLVVEAAPRSGSLITARLANEVGRDVFAIPGSIHAPLSRGCHALIRDGATLVETPADVLVELGIAAVDDDAMAREAEAAGTRSAAKRSRHAEAHDCATRDPAHSRDCPDLECTDDDASPRRFDGGADHLTPASGAARQGAPLPPEALALLDALGHGPVPVDLLAARAGIAADALPHLLLRLELAGRVASLPGDRYQRLDTPATPPAHAVLHSGDTAQPAPPPSSKEP